MKLQWAGSSPELIWMKYIGICGTWLLQEDKYTKWAQTTFDFIILKY